MLQHNKHWKLPVQQGAQRQSVVPNLHIQTLPCQTESSSLSLIEVSPVVAAAAAAASVLSNSPAQQQLKPELQPTQDNPVA